MKMAGPFLITMPFGIEKVSTCINIYIIFIIIIIIINVANDNVSFDVVD